MNINEYCRKLTDCNSAKNYHVNSLTPQNTHTPCTTPQWKNLDRTLERRAKKRALSEIFCLAEASSTIILYCYLLLFPFSQIISTKNQLYFHQTMRAMCYACRSSRRFELTLRNLRAWCMMLTAVIWTLSLSGRLFRSWWNIRTLNTANPLGGNLSQVSPTSSVSNIHVSHILKPLGIDQIKRNAFNSLEFTRKLQKHSITRG